MSICNRVVSINQSGGAIISDNPTETATGTLKVHRCSSAGNTCLTISHANNTKYSYIQLQNDDNSQQYHLGIGNTAVSSTQLRGKHYIYSNPLNKTLMQMDSVGRTKFQTCVGDGGTGNATWNTDTSGVQIIGPCNSNYARLGITAVNCNDSCATMNSIYIGAWDNNYSRIESSGCPMLITSYDGGIGLGNDGNAELCIGTLGDVIITPTTAKNVDPLGTLCLDITGSTNPQNGGIVMNSTSQTHIRFLSSGNLCWQWRHHSPASCDVFSVYSWKRGCDMFMIKAPIDTDTGFTSFGGFGHITSCAPIFIANTLDPYFINSGSKCINFYPYCFGTTSCFLQTHFMVRYDHSQTNVCHVYPTATLYNANDTEGTSSTLAFAGREAGGGNSVGLAYISGRKEGSVATSWACGSLNFLVNCDGCQCWTMCMTMCGGVCAIKCLVSPSIQMANSNCVLCLAATGSGGPYFQGSADCTISYWGVDSSWKAQINSDGGFCAANCVMSPLNCGTLTCACVFKGCTTGAAGASQLFLERRNGTDCHSLNVVVNADDNLVTMTSTGTNGGGFCMNSCVLSPYIEAPIVCASTAFCATSTTIPLSITDSGVATYNWCFANDNVVSFMTNTTSTKTQYFCNAGTGSFNMCVEGCLQTPVVCGTTCLSSNFLLINCNAAGLGCGVTACFSRINDTGPDGHRLAIVVDPAANVVLYCSTGTSLGGHCFYNCAFSPYIYATCLCGTTCVKSPILCASTAVKALSYCSAANGTDSGQPARASGGTSYGWGYQRGGSWTGTDYPDLVLGYHTGVEIGGYFGYGGTRFYNDHPARTGTKLIFLVGCGNCNVCACYDLCAAGNIEAQGDVTSASDCRLKSNITYIKDAIGIVNNLCGRIFIKNDKEQIGVIAQEVEKVLPQVVFQGESEDDYKTVSYGNMVGVLIEAIKEQNTRIDNQQEEIDCLKEIIKSK